eukprot:s1438_g9.t1
MSFFTGTKSRFTGPGGSFNLQLSRNGQYVSELQNRSAPITGCALSLPDLPPFADIILGLRLNPVGIRRTQHQNSCPVPVIRG